MSYNEKIYEIKNGEVTILVETDYREAKFNFKGLILNNNSNVIYKDYIWNSSFNKELKEEISYIKISEFLLLKLKEIADQELAKFITQNINNKDFYNKKNKYEEYMFWRRFYEFKNVMPEIRKEINVSYNFIADGIAECIANGVYCKFDFLQDKFIEIKNDHSEHTLNLTPFDIFYRENKYLILALEQYKKGVAHKAFSEIIRLNEFLEGKKSIKLYFKDGSVVEYKDSYGIRINSIIELIKEEFFIARNYSFRPELKSRKSILELDYLQYGKNKYIINADNLQI